MLDQAVDNFEGFVVFQPIINGIGGNLVSVQASKISTMLHQSSILGIVPPHAKICESPWRALFKGGEFLSLPNTIRYDTSISLVTVYNILKTSRLYFSSIHNSI